MEQEFEQTKETMEAAGDGQQDGGLYTGIDEIASNVTLIRDDETKTVGKKAPIEGRMTLSDFEVLT